jgi:hypothetical protein
MLVKRGHSPQPRTICLATEELRPEYRCITSIEIVGFESSEPACGPQKLGAEHHAAFAHRYSWCNPPRTDFEITREAWLGYNVCSRLTGVCDSPSRAPLLREGDNPWCRTASQVKLIEGLVAPVSSETSDRASPRAYSIQRRRFHQSLCRRRRHRELVEIA